MTPEVKYMRKVGYIHDNKNRPCTEAARDILPVSFYCTFISRRRQINVYVEEDISLTPTACLDMSNKRLRARPEPDANSGQWKIKADWQVNMASVYLNSDGRVEQINHNALSPDFPSPHLQATHNCNLLRCPTSKWGAHQQVVRGVALEMS
jgi:hypothetical protein